MDGIVPFFSIQAMHANINLLAVVKRVLDSRQYILGKEVESFEAEFAKYIGVTYCISVANGTDALELALRAVGIGKGDKVLLVANAGFYGSTALHSIGAIPYYIDIDPITLTMAVDKMQDALQENPKAIIVTHLYGQIANIEAICEIANKKGITVIEDCAQAHGVHRHGKRAGSFGQLACFSFYPTKNLGALGDGGAVVTQDPLLAEKLKQLRQYGWKKKYHVQEVGGRNSRLDEMQAAILREKLPYLDEYNNQRRTIAKHYNAAFADLPLKCPSIAEDHVMHLYVICVDDQISFCEHLKKCGIGFDIHYPTPDHFQPAYPCAQKKGALPITESVCEKVVSLPCYPGLSSAQMTLVIRGVTTYFD